jgi:hypothetical protein
VRFMNYLRVFIYNSHRLKNLSKFIDIMKTYMYIYNKFKKCLIYVERYILIMKNNNIIVCLLYIILLYISIITNQ